MALKTTVKVSGISNLSDARYCAGMGVHMLGFNFSTNSRSYIEPEKFLEIIAWVSGPEIVAEFFQADMDYIQSVLEKFRFDHVQITDLSILHELSLSGTGIIASLDLSRYPGLNELIKDLQYVKDIAEFIIIEGIDPAKLKIDDLISLSESYKIMAGQGLPVDSIPELIGNSKIYGINLKGGQESRVGFKEYDELSVILELIETEDY